jgi:hypothetical protein
MWRGLQRRVAGPVRLVSLAGSAVLIVNIILNVFWVATERDGLKDLGSFLHSGAAYHQGVNPYGYHSWLLPEPISTEALNLNPPISVYLFDYLSRLPTGLVQLIFLAGSIAVLAIALAVLLHAYPDKRNLPVVLAAASFAGVWHMLWYLQLYAPLVLAVVGAWLLLRKGHLVWAGVLIGLVAAIKPNFAIVILALLLARHTRVALPALATAGASSLIPLLVSGPTIYRQWLELTMNFQGIAWTSNASLISVGARLHAPIVGYILASLVLMAVLYVQWRYRPAVLDSLGIALTVAVLMGPVSWAGYTLFLVPFLFDQAWGRGMWTVVALLDIPFAPKQLAAMLGLNMFPIASQESNVLFHAVFGSVYVWAVLLLAHQLLVLRRLHARADASAGRAGVP